MSYFSDLKQKPGFRYFSISFSILVVFIIVGLGCLVSMYKLTNRVYKPIEQSNREKEQFFMADTNHTNIGYTKWHF